MYEFVDRPVAQLDRGGQLLVWAMRNWVAAVGARQCPGGRIAGGFAAWEMLPGLHPFLRMMALFNRHGLANLEFCSPRCPRVSEHEAIILQLVASAQAGTGSGTVATLALLAEEDRIGELALAVGQLARAMRRNPKLVAGT